MGDSPEIALLKRKLAKLKKNELLDILHGLIYEANSKINYGCSDYWYDCCSECGCSSASDREDGAQDFAQDIYDAIRRSVE